MSEFKGTPGKWGVYGTDNCIFIENDNAEHICAINSVNISLQEAKSNAKLIATAPEMLEMLEDILEAFKENNFEISAHEIEELIKKVTS